MKSLYKEYCAKNTYALIAMNGTINEITNYIKPLLYCESVISMDVKIRIYNMLSKSIKETHTDYEQACAYYSTGFCNKIGSIYCYSIFRYNYDFHAVKYISEV